MQINTGKAGGGRLRPYNRSDKGSGVKEQSIKYLLSRKGSSHLQKVRNDRTTRQYERITARFATWLSDRGIKRPSQLAAVYGSLHAAIQTWVDALVAQGKTPATVHTYAAAVCAAAGIPLDEIRKPKRSVDSIIRSRDVGKNPQGTNEALNGLYVRLLTFQAAAGIRRAELARLRGSDLVEDESGRLCVKVRRGKGGKTQLQRILPDDVDTVRPFFDGSEGFIFAPEEMNNHIDLHAIRAAHARRCYRYYAGLDDQERQSLRDELKARYLAFHPDPGKIGRFLAEIDRDGGRYRLRGKSKALAEAQGLPVDYDRLAVMAVSVYHLSHWRLDVTINNYMISGIVEV